jgi:hypothetical protein
VDSFLYLSLELLCLSLILIPLALDFLNGVLLKVLFGSDWMLDLQSGELLEVFEVDGLCGFLDESQLVGFSLLGDVDDVVDVEDKLLQILEEVEQFRVLFRDVEVVVLVG